jgi:hypothetical protein
MKNQITSRDYELLSAYLDNQLDTRERARLESRLKLEPELRRELHELDETRLLMHSLPRLRAPRNYFISAETIARPVGIRQPLRLAPAYGIVSAIATILLVLVIFGDKLISSTSPVSLAPASAAPTVLMEMVQEVEQSIPATSSPAEAAPKLMMEAPILDTQLPPSSELVVGESLPATPTTIYLNALPPTSTPEVSMSILNSQLAIATESCEGDGGFGGLPTLPPYCQTPTESPSRSLLGIYGNATPDSSATETALASNTLALTYTPSPTPSLTASPTSSPTPSLTDTPAFFQEATPETRIQAPLIPAPSEQVAEEADKTLSQTSTSEVTETSPNFDFLQYPVLAIELSLAAIAIIAGLIAIILRIRAGR